MTLEVFRAVTPYITFVLAFIVGALSWFLKLMAGENRRQSRELKENIEGLGLEIRELEKGRQADQKYMYEQYVNKEAFYIAVGKTEGLISRIFEQLNELSMSVNQIIGAINAGKKNKSE